MIFWDKHRDRQDYPIILKRSVKSSWVSATFTTYELGNIYY